MCPACGQDPEISGLNRYRKMRVYDVVNCSGTAVENTRGSSTNYRLPLPSIVGTLAEAALDLERCDSTWRDKTEEWVAEMICKHPAAEKGEYNVKKQDKAQSTGVL